MCDACCGGMAIIGAFSRDGNIVPLPWGSIVAAPVLESLLKVLKILTSIFFFLKVLVKMAGLLFLLRLYISCHQQQNTDVSKAKYLEGHRYFVLFETKSLLINHITTLLLICTCQPVQFLQVSEKTHPDLKFTQENSRYYGDPTPRCS